MAAISGWVGGWIGVDDRAPGHETPSIASTIKPMRHFVAPPSLIAKRKQDLSFERRSGASNMLAAPEDLLRPSYSSPAIPRVEECTGIARAGSKVPTLSEKLAKLKTTKKDCAAHLRGHPVNMGCPPALTSTYTHSVQRPVQMAVDDKWSTDLKKMDTRNSRRLLEERRLTGSVPGAMLPESAHMKLTFKDLANF